MPSGRINRYRYRRNKKRKFVKKNNKRYRRQVATIARPLNVKPKSVLQNVVYYQSFNCNPGLDTTQPAGQQQQNYSVQIALNSLWPFENAWDSLASGSGQTITPNETITPYALPVTDAMTIMPNIKDGWESFKQYNNACVVGTKVTIVASPLANSSDNQLGYLYAIKHSQSATGLSATDSISSINKMPYRQMAKIQGAGVPTSGFQTNNVTSAKLIVKHSPKKFNNVADMRDNKELFCRIGSNAVAHSPDEGDYLTIGVIPSLNFRDLQATKFCLQLRIEQRVLFTEPLEALGTSSHNYSLPWAATARNTAAAMAAAAYMF